MTAFEYVSIALLIVFMIANWFVPRRLGVAGMVLVQLALVITYFVLAAVAMNLGTESGTISTVQRSEGCSLMDKIKRSFTTATRSTRRKTNEFLRVLCASAVEFFFGFFVPSWFILFPPRPLRR